MTGTAEDIRARFLHDKVVTATPAQRIVMVYDRLGLDLNRASVDPASAGEHLLHAMQIVAELQSSLDVSASGAAPNLASLYAFILRELIAVRGGQTDRLPAVQKIVSELRDSWAQAAELVSVGSDTPTAVAAPATSGSWVG